MGKARTEGAAGLKAQEAPPITLNLEIKIKAKLMGSLEKTKRPGGISHFPERYEGVLVAVMVACYAFLGR